MGILFPKTGVHQKTTYATGSYVNGIFVNGASSTSYFTADIQPITGYELETLEIGQKDLGKIKIYTNDNLNVTGDGNSQKGDIITWNGDGQNYEVIAELNYDNNIINHRKYIAEIRSNI